MQKFILTFGLCNQDLLQYDTTWDMGIKNIVMVDGTYNYVRHSSLSINNSQVVKPADLVYVDMRALRQIQLIS